LSFIVNRMFSDVNVSVGSVATYAKCSEILIADLLQIYQGKKFNRLRFDRIIDMRLWPIRGTLQ